MLRKQARKEGMGGRCPCRRKSLSFSQSGSTSYGMTRQRPSQTCKSRREARRDIEEACLPLLLRAENIKTVSAFLYLEIRYPSWEKKNPTTWEIRISSVFPKNFSSVHLIEFQSRVFFWPSFPISLGVGILRKCSRFQSALKLGQSCAAQLPLPPRI